MTVFDFDSKDQGDWFAFFNSHIDIKTGEITYDDPEDGAAEFKIRLMGPFYEERRKNRKKEYKMVLNPSTRGMERVGYYPDLDPEVETKESEDAWDYAITGMRNAFSSPGVEIECTRENKLKLLNIPSFVRFVNRVFEILAESGIKQQEESEGN